MRLVLDTNVLLSAVMRDGFTRALLIHPEVELVMPEYALDEVDRHLPAIAERMGVPVGTARLTLAHLLSNVQTVPREDYAQEMRRADEALKDLDPDDAPFLALALSTGEPLWTQDKVLLAGRQVPTVSTPELAKRLG